MANAVTFDQTNFHIGDTIQISYKLIEKEIVSGKAKREKHEEVRERIQEFKGIVIAIRGEGNNKTFMVRRIASGNIGVERIFPLNSPWIKNIKVIKSVKIRRAKLYYLRQKSRKEVESLKEKVTLIEKKAKTEKKKKKVKTTAKKKSGKAKTSK